MKKAALVAAALAMVLSLAACGNKDNNMVNDPANGNGTTQNGGTGTNSGTNANDNGTANNNGSSTGSGLGTGSDVGTGTGAGTGTASGNNAGTNNGTGTGTGTGTTAGSGTGAAAGAGNNTATSRSAVGNDLRRAADNVGDAVTGLVEDGRSAVARGTSTTSFQRMLDNARVHDVDGVLTDGENSRW
ncbi:MAG: hypothetical protein HDT18_06920 [Oscillibacter sp.]|nr:hypothetical protein [Oscillibacter sp.]